MDDISKEEIDSLVNIAYDDLDSSKTLYYDGKYRNSIVLSYYAMFTMVRALLLKKGFAPNSCWFN